MKLLFQQIFNENFYKMSTCPIIVWLLWMPGGWGFVKKWTQVMYTWTHTHVWTQMHAYLETVIRSWKILVFTCFFGNCELIFYQIHVFYHQECSMIQKNFGQLILHLTQLLWLKLGEKHYKKLGSHLTDIIWKNATHRAYNPRCA